MKVNKKPCSNLAVVSASLPYILMSSNLCLDPAFWYAGGAVGPARYMSRFVAMQIKAKMLGKPLPIYTDTPPRNSSLLKKEVNGV